MAQIDGGIEITSISDIPSSGTGLGSSSTYTVGVLTSLYAYIGKRASAERLAREACEIEIEHCGKPIGKQDQYIAAYGGLQFIQFCPDDTVCVDPIICKTETKKKLEESLLMLYTGITRSADDILLEQKINTENRRDRRSTLHAMTCLAQRPQRGAVGKRSGLVWQNFARELGNETETCFGDQQRAHQLLV